MVAKELNVPVVAASEVAWIGADAMREIDRVMVDDLGITLPQMMENAGRSLAAVVRARFGPGSVLVLAGSGGNGGGGLVAGRHLHNAGIDVRVVLTSAVDRLTPVARHQQEIVQRMGIEVDGYDDTLDLAGTDVVVDAMVGYSLRGTLSGAPLDAVRRLDAAGVPVVSLDVPSGLGADGADGVGGLERGAAAGEGGAGRPVVTADATVTLCLPKAGLRGRPEVGRLYLADISVPPSVVSEVTGGPAPPFDRGPILRVES